MSASPGRKAPQALPPPSAAERQAHLRAYFVSTLRSLFRSKGEVATVDGLDRLRRTLTQDLGAALRDIGLTAEAAQDLAVEAVGAALAKKAVGWLFGKLGE